MRQVPALLLLGSLAALDALAQSGTSLQFLAVAPCRIVDTRNPNGPFGGPFIAGGTSRTIPIPSSACGVPTNASAYSLNFTVVPRTGELAYLSVWPTGQAQPFVSTLNSLDGSTIANAAIVPAGTAGAISAYATNDTDLIVDIDGYFAPPASNTLQFYTSSPCRVLDTRNANGTFGGPSIAGGTSRSFPIPSSSCGVPASAVAYAFNVTVVPQGPLGYLTAWPTGETQPVVSTLNSLGGTVLANAAIVPAGTGGAASFYASNTTDLVVDINGYFAQPGSGGLNFYPVTPCRLADTRNVNGALGGPTPGPATTRTFPLSQGSCGLPGVPSAQAYSLNMTAVPQGVLAYLSTWPTGDAQPEVSTLNAFKGQVVANAAIVPAGGAGSINVYVTNTTDVVIDTNGYFGSASGSPQNPVLSILTAGTGSGTVGASPAGTSCGSGCLSFPAGTAVTLTATPSAGSTFAGWSGACSGTGGCIVTMNSGQTVTASFNLAENLTITTLGSGTGTVVSSPPGTSCGSGCLSFAAGTAVTLTETPAAGSAFPGWSGTTCPGSWDNQNCTFTINSSQTVTFVFNQTGFVGGTAATGSPIAGAKVTLKDSTGKSSSATTTANGAYALSTAGMTPPFLVQVQTAHGNLYSVSADALTTTTINTHPYTDLVIRSWYNAQGQNIDTAFSNPVSMPAPSPANVQLILNAITQLAQLWLTKVNTLQFNMISFPFLANGAGLDQVLDESTVNPNTGAVTISAGGTTQSSTITFNTNSSTITIASTTTGPAGSSANTTTTVVPTQTAQQTALDGILTTLTGFFDAVASNGRQLTADELTPFMAADLVNDGLNQTQLAASLATSWRGGVGGTVEFETVKSIDLVNGIADVVINLDGSEFWFERVDGNWLIGGDNRIAAINLTVQTDTYEGAQSGAGPQIGVQVVAPQGTVTGATISGASAPTYFDSTTLSLIQQATSFQTFQPTPTTQLNLFFSAFSSPSTFLGSNELVPAGTPFTVAVTPASGPAVSYTVFTNVATTDLVTITSPTSGKLSSYTLGEPMLVQWTLPTTFPIIITGVGALTYTGPENSPSSLVCQVKGISYSLGMGSPYTTLVNATSGMVTIPTTCAGMPVNSVVVNVNAMGVNGETAFSSLSIQ